MQKNDDLDVEFVRSSGVVVAKLGFQNHSGENTMIRSLSVFMKRKNVYVLYNDDALTILQEGTTATWFWFHGTLGGMYVLIALLISSYSWLSGGIQEAFTPTLILLALITLYSHAAFSPLLKIYVMLPKRVEDVLAHKLITFFPLSSIPQQHSKKQPREMSMRLIPRKKTNNDIEMRNVVLTLAFNEKHGFYVSIPVTRDKKPSRKYGWYEYPIKHEKKKDWVSLFLESKPNVLRIGHKEILFKACVRDPQAKKPRQWPERLYIVIKDPQILKEAISSG